MPSGQFGRRLSVWKIVLTEAFKKQFFGHGIGAYGGTYNFYEFSPSLRNVMVTNNKQLLDSIADEAKSIGQNDVVKVISEINPDTLSNETMIQLKKVGVERGFDFHEWMPAHNEFLQLFFDVGFVGLLIIGAFIFDLFRRFFMYGNTEVSLALMSSFVAILIISFAHFPFQIARLAAPFVVILAFLDLSLRPKYAVD